MLIHSLPLRPRRLPLVLLFGAILASPACAQVFKCMDASGKTAYQSQPCPESTKGAELDLRWTSSALPVLTGSGAFSGSVTLPEMRRALVSSCTSTVNTRGDAALRRLAAAQPGKFRNFCECVADNSLVNFERVKSMALSNDRAGLEQVGQRAGLTCAPRLQ